jgi:hypothetical protein
MPASGSMLAGKEQQKITAEHVHVHSRGQAVVEVIEAPDGGEANPKEPAHARKLTHEPQLELRCTDEERKLSKTRQEIPNEHRRLP